MECRLANKTDLPQLKTMFEDVVKNMHSQGITIWNEYYPYEEFEYDIDDKQLYLLMDNNVIVAAFVLYKYNNNLSCFNWQDVDADAMLLNRLGVNVNYLRRGIASKVLEEAKKISRKHNAEYIRLTVVDSNIPAINLYKKFGFVQVEGIYEEKISERNITLYEYGFELKI